MSLFWEKETWTKDMDNALVDAFLHQYNEGRKLNGSFTSLAYTNITNELAAKFERPFVKEKVKSRWKVVKKNFHKSYDIFKNLSGFAWNPSTKRWHAEPEVWQKLIEAKPEAKEWMMKPVENYDKLVLTCGDDRAMGEFVMNDADIRQKRPLSESESLGTTEEVTLESLPENQNDTEVTSPEVQIDQEPKPKRSKKAREEAEIEGIQSALMKIADAFRESTAVHEKAFRESTAAYEKCHQKLPIPEDEVWTLLEELQVDSHLLTRAYLYLLEHPDKLRALLGCPKSRQKRFLSEIMFGQGGGSSTMN